ncbi:thioredoxin family protein [Sulfurimonas sp.]|uniref:thioredoxin family protein n=1 Tax=Sulfurimonas sp. TaxID=2022749 RepID=UPI002B4854E2|nr:thioredoxin family protein [Sulfurimonas sp.]
MRIIILFLLLLSSVYANHVSWYGDFDKAHQEALKQNKKLMVLLIKKDCPKCKQTLKTTFLNQTYIENINKDYISVIVTKNQKASYPIEMLYTFTYPSLFFLDNKELFICEPIRGGITPDRLKIHLKSCK